MANKSQKREVLHFSDDSISFNGIDIPIPLKNRKTHREWIHSVINQEKKLKGPISFSFCSDKYLLKMNKKYLNHDFYTDIITFDFCEGNLISGDIYISYDRVKDNARTLGIPFHVELSRVVVHGVLHLIGYKDKTKKDQEGMRAKENYYLSLLHS